AVLWIDHNSGWQRVSCVVVKQLRHLTSGISFSGNVSICTVGLRTGNPLVIEIVPTALTGQITYSGRRPIAETVVVILSRCRPDRGLLVSIEDQWSRRRQRSFRVDISG